MPMNAPPSSPIADDALFQLACAVRDFGYQFTTVTPATHERVNSRSGNEWASTIEGIFGWSRPFRADVLPPAIWEWMRLADVAIRHGEGWRSRVRLSSMDGQLFLHSAYPTLDADAVFFGPDTYRFATLIKRHFARGVHTVGKAVDIGCGAGPGAILCALAQPQASVLAVDINDLALRFTRINAALAGVANVKPRHSNLLADVAGEFDLIVANPPYLVDPAGRAYRHGGGALGAELSLSIVNTAKERLARGGTLLLYTGTAIVDGVDPFRAAVAQRLRFSDMPWSYCEVDPDIFGEELTGGTYAHADRIAAVLLTLTQPG